MNKLVAHHQKPVQRGLLGAAWLLAISLFLISFSAKAAIPVNEDFNLGFNDPAWQMYGPTALNTGWLRLTPASGNQNGAAILTDAFASSTQMVVTFDYAMYGGTGADGLVFFLQDGAEGNIGPGDYGGCLGYCSRALAVQNPRIPGVRSAWVGVAFDEYGNMSDGAHSPTGGPGFTPNHVLIKGEGPADGLTGGYQYLNGVTPAWDLATGSRAGAYTIRILIINNVVTVQRLIAGTFTTFLTQDLTAAGQTLPATLRLGFTAGTGGSTNIHEIDDLTVDFPTDLVMNKTGSTNVASGGPISYTLTVTNSGPLDANNAVITDTIPASITGTTWSCAGSGGASCNAPSGGVGNALSQSVNVPVGGTITVTVNGTVNPATLIGTVISNTATVALPNGLADIVAGDNTDTLNTTVDGAAVSIVATTNAAEPGTQGQFTVSLAQAVTQAVTVNYTVTGTATSGVDYTALSGSIVIPANTTSVVLNVPVLDDSIFENPYETVIVTLNSVTSAFTGTLLVAAAPNNTATITIIDDEKTATMTVPDATGTAASGDTGTVTVTVLDNLGNPAAGVVVDFVVDGDATLNTPQGITDANGQVSVLVFKPTAGVASVTASFDNDGDNVTDLSVVTGSPGVVTFAAPITGLIHEWRLEEVWAAPLANDAIDFVGTWEGTPTDGATNIGTTPALPAVGGQGTCGYGVFDGTNDNIEIGQANPDITTALTLTAWVRTTTVTGGIDYAVSRGLSQPGNNATRRLLYLGINDNQFTAGIRSVGGGLTSINAGTATTNTWTHIALTVTITAATTAQLRLFVNGVQAGATSANFTWPMGTTAANWSVGGQSNVHGNANQWNGNIDEVRMYNSALSAAQIASVRNERHACPGPNLQVIKTVTVVDDTVSVSNDKAIPGSTLLYTITLQNTSPGGFDSENVVVTDNFDDNSVTFVPGSVNVAATVTDAGGVAAKSDRIVTDPLTVPAGGSVTVTFEVEVD